MTTDAEIHAAIAEADRLLAGGPSRAAGLAPAPDNRALFPELGRRGRDPQARNVLAGTGQAEPKQAPAARPVRTAAEVTLDPEQVGEWSQQLGFTVAPREGRITRAND